jgi:imidazolonepropionase-like amidohydrolase
MNVKTIGHYVILVLLALAAPTMAAGAPVVLTNGTIIDSSFDPPVFRASIVIEDQRIVFVGDLDHYEIAEDARLIDVAGKFVIPGLIDTHNHLHFGDSQSPWQPDAVLEFLPEWGVTSVFDTTISIESFRSLKRDQSKSIRARFFAVGRSFGAKDGWGGTRTNGYTPQTEEEAREAVRELASEGVDGIKLVYDDMSVFGMGPWPMLDPSIMAAIIDEAHNQSLKAFVHAPILENAKAALRAGADVLIHGIISDEIDDEFLRLMSENGAYYAPTHILYEQGANQPAMSTRYEALDHRRLIDRSVYRSLWEGRRQNSSTGPRLPILRENLRRIIEAGIPVAMGSDTGVPGVLAGIASQMELVLYVESAMTPLEALESATKTASMSIDRDEDIGSLEPGKFADLVVLDADPLIDIRNVSRIWAVMIGGKFAFAPQPLH